MRESPELIDLVYAATVDPHRYDDLLACWQAHLEGALESPAGGDALSPSVEQGNLLEHFNRGFMILERIGRNRADGETVQMLVDGEPRAAIAVEPSGRILAANGRARDLFAVAPGANIDAVRFDASGLAGIRKGLAQVGREAWGRLLSVSRVQSPTDGSTSIVALTCVNTATHGPVGLLSAAALAWSERIAVILRETFALTSAECDIARGIVEGLGPDRMATARNRSEQTVRTQIKSVLSKLDLRNQAELIRMIAGLMLMDATPEALNSARRHAVGDRMTLSLAGSRRLDVAFAGPAGGDPILFMHGMLDGHGLTREAQAILHKRGLRLICPSRPRFGTSDPDGDADNAPQRFAADIAGLLDRLGIDACPIVGHMAGSVYAFAAAARLGSRITRVISVAGGVPIVSTSQFSVMSPRQRIVARTAHFAPKLLPLILRAGIALLDSGGDRAFMRALYSSAPTDLAVASNPEVFAILKEGYRFAVAQGHRAFEIDAHHVVRDWTDLAQSSRQDVLLVHGRSDPVVGVRSVRAFAERLGDRARMVEHPEQGQLLLHAAPQFVLGAIEQAM